jgi:hypothetical protein
VEAVDDPPACLVQHRGLSPHRPVAGKGPLVEPQPTLAEAERGPQRLVLRKREPLEATQHRRQQLVHPGVGELHLRLDPHSTRHPAARRLLDQVVQQRRLAHARLPVHHQRPTRAPTHRVHELVEHAAFAAPAPQRRGTSPLGGGRRPPGTDTTPTPRRRGSTPAARPSRSARRRAVWEHARVSSRSPCRPPTNTSATAPHCGPAAPTRHRDRRQTPLDDTDQGNHQGVPLVRRKW